MVSESVIISDKPKESSASKIKKKVRFNLNVKSYEPLTRDDYDAYLSEGEDEKTGREFDREERGENSITTALEFEEDDPIASSQIIGGSSCSSSYPANYRYQNCRSSYGEEDEIELEDDSDFDLDDDDEDENYDDNLDSDGEDDNQKQNSASMESEKVLLTAATARLAELGKCKIEQLRDSTDQTTGNKSQIVDSVLNPIENLTQWKAIKAKSRQQQTKQQKENAAVSTQISKSSCSGPQYSKTLPNLDHSSKVMVQGISVDASLSKWLS